MKQAQEDLSQKSLRQVLHYDPRTGAFTWLVTLSRRAVAGSRTGMKPGATGYCTIRVFGRAYRAHRLAWFWVYGLWPEADLDHINGDRRDNRLENLRPASRAQNSWNMQKRAVNTSGFKGVCRARDRYRAYISPNGRQIHLGCFDTPEEAHAAYVRAAKDLFGAFARAD